MDKKILNFLTIPALCLFMNACADPTNPHAIDPKIPLAAKEPVKAPEAVAAQSAFFEMYKPVRQWAPDVMPLTMTSGEIPGIQNEDGKAGMWTAVFVSASKREARTMFYSVADSGTEIHKGVVIGNAQPWGGANKNSKPFSSGAFSVNSDTAYATAAAKAEAWLKKNPGKKLSIFLASESRFSDPAWYFMWGDKKSGYLAFVSATTGQPLAGK